MVRNILEEIRALIEAATPGPFRFVYEPTKRSYIVAPDMSTRALFDNWHNMDADGRLFAASRTLLPKLLAVAGAAKALEAEINRGPDATIPGLFGVKNVLAATRARYDLQRALAALESE